MAVVTYTQSRESDVAGGGDRDCRFRFLGPISFILCMFVD